MREILILSLALAVSACDNNTEFMSAKFSNEVECIATMRAISKGPLKIHTNETNQITGTLANGETFSCDREAGYWNGWYTQQKEQ